mgnify:FL=1
MKKSIDIGVKIMKKAALHNLGCKVNAYETEAMQQMLEEAGYEIVPFSEKADVYVINTCSVTNMADRKSRQMLHRAKKMNPDSIVVGAGCYVQTKEKEALEDLAIDIIIGNNKKHELVQLIDEYIADKGQADKVSFTENAVIDINDNQQEFEEMNLSKTAEHTRAFIKVQDGCNQFCSYCIIPYARGRVRSRSIDNVLAEVKRLAQNGFKEIVLTGIHLSSYGIDCDDNLLHLIQEVHKIDGVKRIRLGSFEPRLITGEFASELSKLEKVCPHFHLSLQSGCDATLKRMNRQYNTEEYEKSCELLRKYFDYPAITTDVIVGFPAETEEEFEITKEYLQKIHFYEMHIFKYSKRQGTRAAAMDNQVPEDIKTKRSAVLIELGNKMSKEYREHYLGMDKEVLFEEKTTINGKDYFVGYTKEYVKVALETEENVENMLVTGRIVKPLNDEVYLMQKI